MNAPLRSPGYDREAADLVGRALAAVAERTPPRRGIGLAPAALVDPPRPSRPRWLPWVGAAAAALVVASGVALAREERVIEGDDLAVFFDDDRAPAALVPGWLPDGVTATTTEPEVSGNSGVTVDAAVLTPDGGVGTVLGAVVSTTSGRALPREVSDRVASALTAAFDAAGDPRVEADGGSQAYVVLGRDGAASAALSAVMDVLPTSMFPRVGLVAGDLPGWAVQRVAVDWLPDLTPTTSRTYEADGGRRVELMAMAGDLPGVADVAGLLEGAEPFAVGDGLGWRAPLGGGDETVSYWQLASGRVGAVVDDGLPVEEVRQLAESVEPVQEVDTVRPTRLLAGESSPATRPRWLVEWSSWLPGQADLPCYTVWVEGEVLGPDCGGGPQEDGLLFDGIGDGAVRVGDTTVVFGEVSPTVAKVTTDAPGARSPSVVTLAVQPSEPTSHSLVVAIVDGDPPLGLSTWRFLDAAGQELLRTQLDLGEMSG
jgi:hypothetical protein